MTMQTSLSAATRAYPEVRRGKRGEIHPSLRRAMLNRHTKRTSLAQPCPEPRRVHPRKRLPDCDCSFLPSLLEGRGLIPSIKNHLFSSVPLAQPYPRKPSSRVDECEFVPFALTHPRNLSALPGERKLVLQVKSHSPRVTDFLIANARLKFGLSHRKISLLKISNRERIAIFHPRTGGLSRAPARLPFLRATSRESRVLDFPGSPWPARRGRPPRCGARLIANPRLEFVANHRKVSPLKISNRKFFAIFHLVVQHFAQHHESPLSQNRAPGPTRPALFASSTIHESQITSHALLIHGSAIRNFCKALKT